MLTAEVRKQDEAGTPVYVPSDQDRYFAEMASRVLAQYVRQGYSPTLQIVSDSGGQPVQVPERAFRLLVDILSHISQGNDVLLTPCNTELTTQQAADVLNVSRPYLVGLLEQRSIPHRKVGTRRRVLVTDVLAYKARIDAERRAVLAEMTALGQEMGEYQ